MERLTEFKDGIYQLKEDVSQYELLITIGILEDVLQKGFYYYNRLGEVKWLCGSIISQCGGVKILGKYATYTMNFNLDDFNKKWWLFKDLAVEEADKYLEEINKYINLKTLKKIVKLESGSTIFVKNDTEIYEKELEENVFYDKYKKALIECYDIDDDYYYKSIENKYKICDYGKTWALTEKELKK